MKSLQVSAVAAFVLTSTTAFAFPPVDPGDPPLSVSGDTGELSVSAPQRLAGSSHGLGSLDGQLVGGGPGYAVTFEGAGPRFVPALGREAPATRSLAVALESIHLGAEALYVSDGPVTPFLADGFAQYQRGSTILERYAAGAEGLWQSFVFDALPAASGDLVVALQLSTDLLRGTAGPIGLSFDEPGLGSVTWGGVTGIDADGRTSPGEVRLTGTRLELVLPAEFVAGASLPLVLDPLIGTQFAVSATGQRENVPDVAYDFSNDLYLAVWEHVSSALDKDVRGQRFDSSGAFLGGTLFVGPGAAISQSPTVANVDKSNKFIVAWEQAESIFGPYDIHVRTVNASDGQMSTGSLRVTQGTGLGRNPQAASEANPFFGEALVVWEQVNTGILGAFIDVPAGGANPSLGPQLAISTNPADTTPAVSKSGGADGVFVVTMQRYDPLGGTPEHDVLAAVVERTGQVTVPPMFLTNTNVANETSARVDGDGRTFMVVYESEVAEGAGSRDVLCKRLAYDASVKTLGVTPGTEAISVSGEDDSQPEVGFFGFKYFVAWVRTQPDFEADVWAMGVDPADCTVCEEAFLLDDSGAHNGGPRMGPQLAGYHLADDQGFLTWWRGENAPPFDVDVAGQLLEAIGAGGDVSNQGGDCGGGGVISASGPAAVGNLEFQVNLTGADATSVWGWFLFSLDTSSTTSCGPCEAFVPLFAIGRPVLGGNASTPLPIPCAPQLLGAEIGFQYLISGDQGSDCPVLDKLSVSDRLAVVIGL